MAAKQAIFSKEAFKFFRDLKRNNYKDWMAANRERYQSAVVQPLRKLMEEMAPTVLKLDPRFETTGRRGANLSRINNDIRFSKDKTLYKTHMYLKFSVPISAELESGQLYTGISTDVVTAGFRLYGGPKRKESPFALIADSRIAKNPRRIAQLQRRLGRKYESYWYSIAKGQWTQRNGWPTNEEWSKVQAWIVRRKFSPTAAMRATFPNEIAKIYRDVYPLLKFISIPK
ncbi:MAG TPA: DUF2461 family protein [Candidatus Sulfotelmatobacter sp.]|jgi:uncharacterized protein (TIGR02453 family)|nr:DUF2461 family protein [Candidatus Sulfotelmatobacter sp.]